MTTSTNGTAVAAFNALPGPEATRQLLTCLAVPRWAQEVADGRPYADMTALTTRAEAAAAELSEEELTAALARHPGSANAPVRGTTRRSPRASRRASIPTTRSAPA